jgi:hypothetical protein
MPNYKDTNNNVHFLDDSSFSRFLPQGSIEISDDEAEAIRLSKINPQEVAFASAMKYLVSTDYKMTADYDKDTTDIKVLRSQARATIRAFLNEENQ